jgi:molybdate transport system regulatory protein
LNTLSGKIKSIQTKGSLSLVKVLVGKNLFTSIVIDTPETAPFLKEGNEVKAVFKETEVALGTDENHAISMQNQVSGTVKEVKQGELLSRVVIQIDTTAISSIITTNALTTLNLAVGMPVKALIKTNEIMLSE